MDALEPFYPERLAGRVLGMGDVVTLVRALVAALISLGAGRCSDNGVCVHSRDARTVTWHAGGEGVTRGGHVLKVRELYTVVCKALTCVQVEKAQDAIDEKDAAAMMRKMLANKFDLDDFLSQARTRSVPCLLQPARFRSCRRACQCGPRCSAWPPRACHTTAIQSSGLLRAVQGGQQDGRARQRHEDDPWHGRPARRQAGGGDREEVRRVREHPRGARQFLMCSVVC
jgi:hypothetical protein